MFYGLYKRFMIDGYINTDFMENNTFSRLKNTNPMSWCVFSMIDWGIWELECIQWFVWLVSIGNSG